MCTLKPGVFCESISKRDEDLLSIQTRGKEMSQVRDMKKCGTERRWLYRGEGNRCLVVADNKTQIVYRLVKQPCKQMTAFIQQSPFIDESERIHSTLKDMGDYMRHVLQQHISPHFLSSSILKEVSPELVAGIMDSIRTCRPERRVSRGLDPDCRSALTMPDLCFVRDMPLMSHSPTISIEIKPKRGILPVNTRTNNCVRRAPCRYCMHQVLKVKQKIWPERSSYCPIDLFSGNPSRMKKALTGLLDTPQNNLKICRNGVEIYPRGSLVDFNSHLNSFFMNDEVDTPLHSSHLHRLMELIVQALLWSPLAKGDNNHVARCDNHNLDVLQEIPQFCEATPATEANTTYGLTHGCVLERIRHVQQIDALEIDGIYPLYQRLMEHLDNRPSDRYKWNIDGPYTPDWWSSLNADCDQLSLDYALHKIKEFLMSTTASDCSLMIALQPTSNHSDTRHVIRDLQGRQFLCSIGVIDLDPKPFDKIPTYFRRNKEIIRTYMDCIDTSVA